MTKTKRTAQIAYDERRKIVQGQLDKIQKLLKDHDGFQSQYPEVWGYVGNLDYVEEMLGDVVRFLK